MATKHVVEFPNMSFIEQAVNTIPKIVPKDREDVLEVLMPKERFGMNEVWFVFLPRIIEGTLPFAYEWFFVGMKIVGKLPEGEEQIQEENSGG